MHSRWTLITLVALVLAEVVGSFAVMVSNVTAQAQPLVIVFRVETGRDVCEVQYRKSDDDTWGRQTIEGPPTACQGGVTYGTTMTSAEASREVARSSTISGGGNVVVVPLTGSEIEDQAAIDDAITSLHESVDTGDPDLAFASELGLGFMAPGALADDPMMKPAVLLADCRSGRVGQRRRVDVKIDTRNDQGYGSLIEAIVIYKRISCARWRIKHVKMTPLIPVPNRLWFRNFYYKRGAWLGDHYGNREAGKQCRTLRYGDTYDWQPEWEIRAKGPALIELVDEHPDFLGNGPSCIGGAGTSYTSAWFYLPGGTK